MTQGSGRCASVWALLVLLATYVALAVAYSVLVPIGETPDEIGHIQFVRYVATHRRLPVQELRPNNEVGEGHQAPLFYILAAIPNAFVDASDLGTFRTNAALDFAVDGAKNKHAMIHTQGEEWPYTGYVLAWHLTRWVSVVSGLLAVVLAYRLGYLAFGGDEALATAVAAAVAFNPEFLFISGAASNDALAAALGAALTLLGGQLLAGRQPTVRTSAVLGVDCGLAALTKLTLAVPAALALGVLLYRLASLRQRPWRQLAAWGAAAAGVSGWWFARNLSLYGDALALNVDRAQNPGLVRGGPPDLALLRGLLLVARDSYFARFGWMNVAPPTRVYDWLTLLLAAAAAGLLICLGRSAARRLWGADRRGMDGPGEPFPQSLVAPEEGVAPAPPSPVGKGAGRLDLPTIRASVLALGLGCLLALMAAQLAFAIGKGPSAYQGRYLFPAAAGAAVGLVAGWSQLLAFRARWPLAAVTAVAGVAFSLYCLLRVIVPAYPEPIPVYPPSREVRPPTAVGARLGEDFELLGYEADEASWRAGGCGAITLYWRARQRTPVNYTVFVQLIDGDGRLVTQSDSWPLKGRFPTSRWLPGEKVLDAYELDLRGVGPGRYRLFVGIYDLADMRRLPVYLAGQAPSDRVELERSIAPPAR